MSWFVKRMIHFLYSWPETLDCTLSQTKFFTLPTNPVFQNFLHRQFMLIKYVVLIWSSGNRKRARVQERSSRSRLGGRITSPRVWFGAGGQGVTLELAWGPRNCLRNLHFVLLSFLLVSCFSSFFLLFLFLGIYLLGHCGNFFDTGVGSCRLRFFFLFFLLLFFSF